MSSKRAAAEGGTSENEPTLLSSLAFSRFGADPYLTGENAFYYIDGMQSTGVAACIKHLIG